MWEFTDPFWATVFKWATISAFVFGAIGLAGALISAWVGYEITDATQREAGNQIKEAQARIEEAKAQAAEANKRAAEAQERLAVTEERVLNERRLTARERMRLAFVERAVLPRQITQDQFNNLLPKLKGQGCINIAVVNKPEPENFALQLTLLFQQAGIMGGRISLPSDGSRMGVITYAVDAHGAAISQILWGERIGGGLIQSNDGGKSPIAIIGLEKLPHKENVLIIGENDGAFQPMDGQPGEGLDKYGGPDPAPH